MPDLETWLTAPTLSDVAVRLEGLRLERPMNGDGSNHMLDKAIRELCKMQCGTSADATHDDPGCPATAASMERDRLKTAREQEYMRTYGNEEWQAEQRRKHYGRAL